MTFETRKYRRYSKLLNNFFKEFRMTPTGPGDLIWKA